MNIVLQTPKNFRSPELLSPSGRKVVSLSKSTSKGLSGVASTNNDDDTEKTAQIIDSTVKSKTEEPPMQFSKADINASDHLQFCLRLSAENKITKKNAFDLHLIDIADELVVKKGNTDFNLAGYALEACAKIYVCRVDSLHDIATKLTSRLNQVTREDDDNNDNDEYGERDDDDGGGMPSVATTTTAGGAEKTNEDKEAKRCKDKEKRKRKKKTIISKDNLKSITLDLFETDIETSVNFKKTVTSFDMGAPKNLLLNTSRMYDDSCEIVIDPCRKVDLWGSSDGVDDDGEQNGDGDGGGGDSQSSANQAKSKKQTDKLEICIDDLIESVEKVVASNRDVCPTFANFNFAIDDDSTAIDQSYLDEYKFNPSFVDPRSGDHHGDHHGDYSGDEDGGGGGFMEPDDGDDIDDIIRDGDVTGNGGGIDLHTSSSHIRMSVTNDSALMQTIQKIKSGDMSGLKEVLDPNNECSLYKNDFLKMWAGPDHWRKPININTNKSTKPAKRKETFYVKFDSDDDGIDDDKDPDSVSDAESTTSSSTKNRNKKLKEDKMVEDKKKKKKKRKLTKDDVDWHFMKTRATTTTRRWESLLESDERLLLLPDLADYEENDLLKLFHTDVKIVDETPATQASLNVSKYDYSNDNDRLNFCPSQPTNNNNDNNDDDGGGGFYGDGDDNNDDDDDGGDDNNNANEPPLNGDADGGDNDDIIPSQNVNSEDGMDVQFGNNLVPQPRMIPKTLVNYARVDKKIDMDLLKKVTYDVIRKSFEKSETVLFTKVHALIQKNLPKKLLSDLSLPISFASLLHLANEHSLNLKSSPEDNYAEVFITKAATFSSSSTTTTTITSSESTTSLSSASTTATTTTTT